MSKTTDIIFCGNPGVGKSSIATSISGIQFESGLSFGSGLTVSLTWNESPKLPNIRFADTPGLADMELKEKAAAAITQALQEGAAKGHDTKIIFVVTLESARLRPADLYTIKTVMSSIKDAKGNVPGLNSYSVIINKCEFLDNPKFLTSGSEKIKNMLTDPALNPIPTGYIQYLPATPDLAGKDNAKVFFPGLVEWLLATSPAIQVSEAEPIDTSCQEEIIERMREEHAARMAELLEMTDKQAQELAAESKARQDMETRMKREMAEWAERSKQLEEQAQQANIKAQLASEKAATAGGGWMGKLVDFGTLISKPIVKSIVGKSDDDFEREWNRSIATVKQFCVL